MNIFKWFSWFEKPTTDKSIVELDANGKVALTIQKIGKRHLIFYAKGMFEESTFLKICDDLFPSIDILNISYNAKINQTTLVCRAISISPQRLKIGEVYKY